MLSIERMAQADTNFSGGGDILWVGSAAMQRCLQAHQEGLTPRDEAIWSARPKASRTLTPKSTGSWTPNTCWRSNTRASCIYLWVLLWTKRGGYDTVTKPGGISADHDLIVAHIRLPVPASMRSRRCGTPVPKDIDTFVEIVNIHMQGNGMTTIERIEKWDEVINGTARAHTQMTTMTMRMNEDEPWEHARCDVGCAEDGREARVAKQPTPRPARSSDAESWESCCNNI